MRLINHLGWFFLLLSVPIPAFEIEQKSDMAKPARSFWSVYGNQDLSEVEQTLESLRTQYPNWEPGLEIINALDRLQARAQIIEAEQAGQHQNALAIYDRRAQLRARGCADPTLRWVVARAAAGKGDTARAQALLREMLRDCASRDTRAGTAGVMSELFEPSTSLELIDELTQADSLDEATAEDLRALVRNEQQSGIPLVEAFTSTNQRLPKAQETQFAQAIEANQDRAAANVLGWYYYDLKRYAQAAQWFEQSRQWGPNANAIEGLTRTRLAQQRPADAERLARPWVEQWESVRAAYTDAALSLLAGKADLSSQQMQAIQQTAQQNDHAGLWSGIGWYQMQRDIAPAAQAAFANAVAIKPSAKAVEGLVIAHRALNNRDQAAELISQYSARGGDYQKRLEPLKAGQTRAIQRWYDAGDYLKVIEAIRPSQASTGDQLLLAWSHYHAGNIARAHDLFAQLHQQSPSPDTAEGLRVTRQIGR